MHHVAARGSVSSRACAASKPNAVRSLTSGAKSEVGRLSPLHVGLSEHRGASVHSLKTRNCSTKREAWVALHFRRVRTQNKDSPRFVRSQNPLRENHVAARIAPQESRSLSVAEGGHQGPPPAPANCVSCAPGPSAALRAETIRTGSRWPEECRSKPVGQQRQAFPSRFASNRISLGPDSRRAGAAKGDHHQGHGARERRVTNLQGSGPSQEGHALSISVVVLLRVNATMQRA